MLNVTSSGIVKPLDLARPKKGPRTSTPVLSWMPAVWKWGCVHLQVSPFETGSLAIKQRINQLIESTVLWVMVSVYQAINNPSYLGNPLESPFETGKLDCLWVLVSSRGLPRGLFHLSWWQLWLPQPKNTVQTFLVVSYEIQLFSELWIGNLPGTNTGTYHGLPTSPMVFRITIIVMMGP